MKSVREPEVGIVKLDMREVRCECGSLVAKLVGSAIELKCRRCKRLALIPFTDFKGGSQTVTVRL